MDDIDVTNHQDHVILLHGMYRSAYAMKPVERFFTEQGYKVTNISYPSTEQDIESLVNNYLAPVVESLMSGENTKLHFVTHSMGGILVRYYLQHNGVDNLGKVVMIAPPNHGTALAELFADSSVIDTNSGPAKEQLSSQSDSWVNQLGPVDFELGVIAGNYNKNPITAWLLAGDDDGVVAVESTKVENMNDFITVADKHFRLRSNKTVLQQAAYFLKYSAFFRRDSISLPAL